MLISKSIIHKMGFNPSAYKDKLEDIGYITRPSSKIQRLVYFL